MELEPELVETQPIDVVKPDLYLRLLGGQAIDNIVLSSN